MRIVIAARWAALYLPNATFGAQPEDYITLFLWGATVNVVAGQQIKLETIYGHKVDPKPAAGANLTPPANAGGGHAGGDATPPAQDP